MVRDLHRSRALFHDYDGTKLVLEGEDEIVEGYN